MKFIPGTKFNNRTGTNTKLFKNNKIYILLDISLNADGNAIYKFSQNGEVKEVIFKSISEADRWLETIIV
jgi:hypothetical protein